MVMQYYNYLTPEGVTKAGPLTVVLYGGPGSGKSTVAAGVFSELKRSGIEAELVHEYAKDLTWEKADARLSNQPLIAAEQMWRMDRLGSEVDCIVTDTSPLLGLVYGTDKNRATPAFRTWLRDDYRRRNTLNILLRRGDWLYRGVGRRQSEHSAMCVDTQIRNMLHDEHVSHFELDTDSETVDKIVSLVGDRLA